MRVASVAMLGMMTALAADMARAELVFADTASIIPVAAEEYPHPAVPSIVFVDQEAREAGLSWLPSHSPVIIRPPLVLNAQQQQQQAAASGINMRSLATANGGTYASPGIAASASLNMAHAYRVNLMECAPSWALRFGIAFGGRNCSFSPFLVPYVFAPQQPGFNQPADRLPNAANAARTVDQARNYRLRK